MEVPTSIPADNISVFPESNSLYHQIEIFYIRPFI